jgi:hypothetical protein
LYRVWQDLASVFFKKNQKFIKKCRIRGLTEYCIILVQKPHLLYNNQGNIMQNMDIKQNLDEISQKT